MDVREKCEASNYKPRNLRQLPIPHRSVVIKLQGYNKLEICLLIQTPKYNLNVVGFFFHHRFRNSSKHCQFL